MDYVYLVMKSDPLSTEAEEWVSVHKTSAGADRYIKQLEGEGDDDLSDNYKLTYRVETVVPLD